MLHEVGSRNRCFTLLFTLEIVHDCHDKITVTVPVTLLHASMAQKQFILKWSTKSFKQIYFWVTERRLRTTGYAVPYNLSLISMQVAKI